MRGQILLMVHGRRPSYGVIVPQAIRSPAFPAGSVFMSSALAWITIAVPPLANREYGSAARVKHNVVILHGRFRRAVFLDGDVRQVAGVMALGVLKTMLPAGGIEVGPGRFEVGRIALGILMEVHRVLAGRQVVERQLYFHTNSVGD